MYKSVLVIACLLMPNCKAKCQTDRTLSAIDQQDSTFKVGKLKNGLRYYLMKTRDDNVAINFIVRAGRSQESANQAGVAHLLEHLPFRETKHFIRAKTHFRERIHGKDKFGASTGVDMTRYRSVVPSNQLDVIREVFQFYREVSKDIVINDLNVDAERNIVYEEGRLTEDSGDDLLLRNIVTPIIMGNNHYSKLQRQESRENVLRIKTSEVIDFYHRWYNPNNEAIIVVGDFNIIEIEKEINKQFSSLRRRRIPNRLNQDTSFFNWKSGIHVIADTNLVSERVEVYVKRYAKPGIQNEADLREMIFGKIFNHITASRANSKQYTDGAPIPFLYNYTEDRILGPRFSCIKASAPSKGEDPIVLTKRILSEYERLRRFGVTDLELQSAKEKVLFDSDLFGLAKSEHLAGRIAQSFVNGGIVIDGSLVSKMARSVISSMSLENFNMEISNWLAMRNNVDVFIIEKRPKQVLPEKFLFDYLNGVGALHIEPWQEIVDTTNINGNALMLPSQIPTINGLYLKQMSNITNTVKGIVFPNGIEVIVKKMELPASRKRALLKSFTPSLNKNAAPITRHSHQFIYSSGLGEMSRSSFLKYCQQNDIDYITPYNDDSGSGFVSSFDVRSIEKVLQAIYLYSTRPRIDSIGIETTENLIKENLSRPMTDRSSFLDTVDNMLSGRRNYRFEILNGLKKLHPDSILKDFSNKFSVTVGSRFVIIGDVEVDSILFDLCRYLGKIPKRKPATEGAPISEHTNQGFTITTKEFNGADVSFVLENQIDDTESNRLKLTILNEMLRIKLVDRLRTKENGIYALLTDMNVVSGGFPFLRWRLSFTCAPKLLDRLTLAVKEEVENVRVSDFDTQIFDNIKSKLIADVEKQSNSPSFWIDYYSSQPQTPIKALVNNTIDKQSLINNIYPSDIKQLAYDHLKIDSIERYALVPIDYNN